MALPEQIRKQTEAVQELYKQLNAGQESGEETPQADEPVTPVESSAADEPAPNDPVAPSPAPEQKTGDDKASEDFAQKYKTLQGMYNAEVPRLHQRIQQMEQLLASLSSQPTPAASAPAAATATPPAKLVTEKDVEEYGDAIDMMRKVTKEEMNAVMQRMSQLEGVLQQFQSNVVPQVQAVAQKQAVTAEQQFWADLTSTVSNWREVNDNQAFQAWLLEMDPLTGITRQTYLEDAQRALDARRVSAFFRTWLESTGQANVAQTQGSSPAPAAKSELEKQVTPGRARSAGTPQTNKGKVYTPEDIKKFFNDVRSGKYRGREQERDRIERDIFTAQRENRIQVTA